MLKPRAPRGKRSPGPKKRFQEIEAKAMKVRGDGYVVLEATKSYDGKPAYMQDFANNMERVNQMSGINYLGVFKRPSDEQWDRVVAALLEMQEGEDVNAAVERIGIAFAKAFEDTAEPYKNGKTVGMKKVCRFAYINNEEPEYLNAIVGDHNAAKIIAQSYQDYIEDGSFEESLDDIIATYFDESVDTERVKKKIQYEYKTLLC